MIVGFGLLAVFECVFVGAYCFAIMSFSELSAASHAGFNVGTTGTSRASGFTKNTNQRSNGNADNEEVKNTISCFLFFHGANQ